MLSPASHSKTDISGSEWFFDVFHTPGACTQWWQEEKDRVRSHSCCYSVWQLFSCCRSAWTKPVSFPAPNGRLRNRNLNLLHDRSLRRHLQNSTRSALHLPFL